MKISDMPTYYCDERFELIYQDGRVWINNETGLIGRFGPKGIDVHADGECLDCKTGTADFNVFANLMFEKHGIDLSHLAG
jgi:hypothetical protein